MAGIRERIQNGDFENVLPYPTNEILRNDPAYQALDVEQSQLLDRTEDLKGAKKALIHNMQQEYDNESSVLRAEFKTALEKEYELQNHPKKDKIWQKAWDDGHSGGWQSILNEYDEIVDLLI